MSASEDQSILRNSVLFEHVSDEVLRRISVHCVAVPLAAGETLFEQDSASDALYFLVDGQVHVIRHYDGDYDIVLATEHPYYVIGELSLLANLPRTGSVVAVSDCDLLRLDRDAILAACEEMPEIAVTSLELLGQRLYGLNLRVRENAILNVGARLASALRMLAHDENGPIDGEVSSVRLARATAVSPDVAEHTLRSWEQKGILSVDGRNVTVHDVEALKNIAG